MAEAPAIVRFDRGRRLGQLAAAAAVRKRPVAAKATLSSEELADRAVDGAGCAGGVASASRVGSVSGAGSATAGSVSSAGSATGGSVSGAASVSGTACAGGAGTAVGVGRGGAGSRQRRFLLAAGAVGAVGMLAVPLPAGAAPAPCEQAERYSAQSGSQILRLNALGSTGGQARSEVHVGDAKSAMVAQAPISSAAVARVIDAVEDEGSQELSGALQQQAPPTNKRPNRRTTGAADVGPISLGAGTLSTHAQWEAGMACGVTYGEVTRATARLRDAGIGADGDAALVRVPGKVQSESTTELERHGDAAATVASAGLDVGTFELLDGAVKVAVRKAPSLRASMSIKDGGEVRYIPATVEVSGAGFKTERLDTAGDEIEITLHDPKKGTGAEEAGNAAPGLLGALGKTRLLGDGDGASLPGVPELPEIAEPRTETAPVTEPGTKVRISLGDVRQAARGRAIAARAAALSVTITQAASDHRTKPAYGEGVLDFDMGVLEAAAVAPETPGAVSGAEAAGSGGGLPITGPRVDVMALSGVALLIAGTAALIFGMRGRPRP